MKKPTLPLRPFAERHFYAAQHSKLEQEELEKIYSPKRVLDDVTESPLPSISAIKRAA
jgi:hypothetical protein